MRHMSRKARRSSNQKSRFFVTQSFTVERNSGVINNFGGSKVKMKNLNGQPDYVEFQVEPPVNDVKPEFVEEPVVVQEVVSEPQTVDETEQTSSKMWFWGVAIAVAAIGIGIIANKNK